MIARPIPVHLTRAFRSCIWVPMIDEIARQYIELAQLLLVADLP